MTVRNGREFLAIPGPTNVPDEVLNAMHRPAIEIYSGALVDITARCLADLKKVFRTEGRPYIYAANGHGAWEAALSNVLSRGDTVLVLQSGRFAVGWGETAAAMGAKVETVAAGWREAVDPAAVEARLREDKAGRIKAVLVVQIDTASGVVNDIPAIRKAMDNAGHGALLMVDTIASLGTMPFEMDAWRVDVAVTGSQKGLMTPPGLGFVAAGPRAAAVHETADLRTRYWDWTLRNGDQHYQIYCGTPPEHLMFGLRKALDMLLEEGLENVFRRHALLAEAVRRAVAVWAEGGALEFNIPEPAHRADSVTTILLREGLDPRRIRGYCERHCGVVLGVGIGELTGKALRIAHMGHVNAPMILGTLGAVEVSLQALGIAHGKGGVQAAVDWLGSSLPPE
jgi:alanine-glyoxylate transaminase/serine-glyoxylate transaminase/serine-pyruvate transaminase